MSGSVFDRLQQKLDVQKREEGISVLEIAQLPPNLRKIMRLMLRQVEMTHQDLCKAIRDMPGKDPLSQTDLDEALDTLTRQNWLIRRGEGECLNYSVNLRRKKGSTLSQSIWSALETRISQDKDDKPSKES